MKNNNTEIYNTLSIEDKKSIQMYITARQFKNAIFEDEVFIIPAKAPASKIKIGDLMTITSKGDKYITRLLPYVVNISFACELYLKLLLTNMDINLKKLKGKEKHSLLNLYNKFPTEIKKSFSERYIKASEQNPNPSDLEQEIKKISDVFIDWRYIHEKLDHENTINIGFLKWFCDALDQLSISALKRTYNYDVTYDIR